MPESNPSIAVIIPCFNHGEYVQDAIKSVVAQNYPNVSIFISDEGSTDDSWEKIRNMMVLHDSSTDLIIANIENVPTVLSRNLNPNGPSGARNRLIQMAWDSADAFMMLDADDQYLPDKIEKSVAKMKDGEGLTGIVYTDAIIYHEKIKLSIREYREPYSRLRLEQECIISNTPLVTKEALSKVGLYDETMRTAEDWDLWLRITEQFMAVHIPEALHIYRVTGKNASNVVPQEVWEANWKKISERINARH